MEDRWLSVDEIAAYLGIKRDTVYRWISKRNLPGHKIGRLCLPACRQTGKFWKEGIDEWVESGLSAGGDAQAGDYTLPTNLIAENHIWEFR